MSTPPEKERTGKGRIELRLRDLGQLFNSMDPSPFWEKDIDDDAETFIVEWAEDFPTDQPVELVIHVEKAPDLLAHSQVTDSVHRYFEYQAERHRRRLRALFKQGRISLAVGLSFLGACLVISDLVHKYWSGPGSGFVAESFYIGGWVAMWRPLEVYLYDWWPIRRTVRVYNKLSEMDVHLRVDTELAAPNDAMRKLVTRGRRG